MPTNYSQTYVTKAESIPVYSFHQSHSHLGTKQLTKY